MSDDFLGHALLFFIKSNVHFFFGRTYDDSFSSHLQLNLLFLRPCKVYFFPFFCLLVRTNSFSSNLSKGNFRAIRPSRLIMIVEYRKRTERYDTKFPISLDVAREDLKRSHKKCDLPLQCTFTGKCI